MSTPLFVPGCGEKSMPAAPVAGEDGDGELINKRCLGIGISREPSLTATGIRPLP
jgi:hypothetical protein